MTLFKKLYILFILCAFQVAVSAQSLTGTWEGALDGKQYFKINIIQKEDSLCGFTYDYTSGQSFCKANFKAAYSEKKKLWFTTETDFIENKGNHILMQLQFKMQKRKGKDILNGFYWGLYGKTVIQDVDNKFTAERISLKPENITSDMKAFSPDYIISGPLVK